VLKEFLNQNKISPPNPRIGGTHTLWGFAVVTTSRTSRTGFVTTEPHKGGITWTHPWRCRAIMREEMRSAVLCDPGDATGRIAGWKAKMQHPCHLGKTRRIMTLIDVSHFGFIRANRVFLNGLSQRRTR